jgi:hypothetical protein
MFRVGLKWVMRYCNDFCGRVASGFRLSAFRECESGKAQIINASRNNGW